MGPEIAPLKATFRNNGPTPLFVFKASVDSLTGQRNFPDHEGGFAVRD